MRWATLPIIERRYVLPVGTLLQGPGFAVY